MCSTIKKLSCLVAVLITAFISRGQNTSVYSQIASVNKQWFYQKDFDKNLEMIPAGKLDEVHLIQLHLRETEKLLRSRSTSQLAEEQKNNRASLLDILHKYWMAGVFPKNTFHKERRPYFIDIFNNYCAVGYLMKMSGADKMAREIHASQNFSYMKDIYHPNLAEWVSRSGFTVDELALIQPAYDCYPTSIVEMHYNNTGSDVNEYIEFIQASPFFFPYYGHVSRIEFYDNSNTLYKTVSSASFQSFVAGPANGVVSQVGFSYYVFPAGESFADAGQVRLINNTAGVDRNIVIAAYDAAGMDMTYYATFGGNAGLPVNTIHYSIVENGTNAPGISLNFCSPGCSGLGTVNYFPDLLPASIGSPNLTCLVILPVNLLKFDYSILSNRVNLNWQTAFESNTDRFEIERSSDGANFQVIGTIRSSGSSSIAKDYQFVDFSASALNYYRLKQIDQDGKFTYSKILEVKLKQNSPLIIQPNLVTDQLQVRINLLQKDIQSLRIFDNAGRVVYQNKAIQGLNEINIARLHAGNYYVRIETVSGECFNKTFVKQ